MAPRVEHDPFGGQAPGWPRGSDRAGTCSLQVETIEEQDDQEVIVFPVLIIGAMIDTRKFTAFILCCKRWTFLAHLDGPREHDSWNLTLRRCGNGPCIEDSCPTPGL